MGDEPEKKKDHGFLTDIAKTVISGILMLICTTLYNLLLAHIWPVTIHFGEYSLNNFIFVLVSVVSSILLAMLIMALEMFYIFSSITNTILDLITPKDKRKKRKRYWYEFILNTFLLASFGLFNGMVWLSTLKSRKEMDKTTSSKEAQKMLENLPALKQKEEQ